MQGSKKVSIPKVVRLKGYYKKQKRMCNYVSIPKVVRLKVRLLKCVINFMQGFNSKSGSIKRGGKNLISSINYRFQFQKWFD